MADAAVDRFLAGERTLIEPRARPSDLAGVAAAGGLVVDIRPVDLREKDGLLDGAIVVGRNVLEGRWTFQIMEEFDDGYYQAVRDAERRVRDELMDGRRHVFEAELKEERRTRGRPNHESRPTDEPQAPG